jgi:hypothetical protein
MPQNPIALLQKIKINVSGKDSTIPQNPSAVSSDKDNSQEVEQT